MTLLSSDADRYQPWLRLTRNRLEEIGSALDSPDQQQSLESLIGRLRDEAYATAEELEHGVTLSKAGARDRLRDALERLAEIYEKTGQEAKAKEIWRSELGELYTEALRIRSD